jgi:hypothetical protein
MARGAISGEWARQNLQQYSGALVWGTGINPVHSYYGSQNLRMGATSQREGEITPPHMGFDEGIIPSDLWGYQLEDSLWTGVDYDDRPVWTETAPAFRNRTDNHPSWSAPGLINTAFRALRDGAHRTFRGAPIPGRISYQVPSETVSEGWLNKAHGMLGDATPSDDKQLIIQTSMTQRYQTRTNEHAVARNTDDARAGISSLVTGQKVKEYSGGERHYDMAVREQDTINRPFWWRTAGTGRTDDMVPNTLYTVQPIQRIPPGEPSQGQPETGLMGQYGYTSEDHFYA